MNKRCRGSLTQAGDLAVSSIRCRQFSRLTCISLAGHSTAWILKASVLAYGLLVGVPAWAQIVCGDLRLDRIVVPERSPEPIRFAAEELRAYLKRSVGVDLPIKCGGPERGAFFITATGLTSGAEEKVGGFTHEPNRKFDRTVIAERGGCFYLIGENDRSALYAVYDFLQERVRIRFYGPGPANEVVPAHKELKIEAGLTLRKGSALEYRNYMSWRPQCQDFLAKNRINMILILEEAFGDNHKEAVKRGMLVRGPGHCWNLFLPDKAMFGLHPEYFPMRDGRRAVTGQGACFSNPEVRLLFVNKVSDYLRCHRFWDVFALWAEDAYYPSYCDCAACKQKTAGEWYRACPFWWAEVAGFSGRAIARSWVIWYDWAMAISAAC